MIQRAPLRTVRREVAAETCSPIQTRKLVAWAPSARMTDAALRMKMLLTSDSRESLPVSDSDPPLRVAVAALNAPPLATCMVPALMKRALATDSDEPAPVTVTVPVPVVPEPTLAEALPMVCTRPPLSMVSEPAPRLPTVSVALPPFAAVQLAPAPLTFTVPVPAAVEPRVLAVELTTPPAPTLSVPVPVTDSVWCRRVYLDLAGRIPTTAELDSFLQSPAEVRRAELVDRLLQSGEYAVRMRELWDVFLMGRPGRNGREDRRRQHGWWSFLEGAFRDNRPWNETVRSLLVARGDLPTERGASWFLYERRNNHQAIAEAVAPLIYGTRIDCAQCHDHPLTRDIRQAHYWGLVTAFNRSKNVDGGAVVSESATGGFVNFTNLKKESQPALMVLLDDRVVEELRPAEGEKQTDGDDLYVDGGVKQVPKLSRRQAFADLAVTGNPRLADAFVNRMWSVLLGRGLVHPVDEMNGRNPASHPELLSWLSRDFEAHGYDVKRLVRGLVLSRPYGLGSVAGGEVPAAAFAAAIERPLTGEQLARSWRVVAGVSAEDDGLRRKVTGALPDVLPREYAATWQQAQFLSGAAVLEELLRPEVSPTAARLSALSAVDERVRLAFQEVWGRDPDADEQQRSAEFFAAHSGDASVAVRDFLWALVTSAEFLTVP